MTFIRQKHKTDCGIAVLAMLCNVTYEEADRAIPWRREDHLYGTTTTMLREGGIKLGYRTESTPQDRLKPLMDRGWESIPDNSLVKIPHPEQNGGWHWVAWRKGKIYDPARGVFSPKNFIVSTNPTSYMQFIKENDDPCPECEAQLDALWSGVKCPTCGYAFCY